jgi:DNA-binding transcriptional LysR family regulator
MTIHQIECFLEVAQRLNFTEAANRLYISQQGLSRQIAALEKELELKLFDRTTREVRLTRSGEFLLWKWKDIPKDIYDAVGTAREEGEHAKSRIRLTVLGIPGIARMATSLVADYMEERPGTEFEIEEFLGVKDLTNSSTDALLSVSYTNSYEKLKDKCGFYVVKRLPMYIVMSKKNPLAQKEMLELDDLKEETLLSLYREFFSETERRLLEMVSKQEHILEKTRYYENINSLELALLANEGIHFGFREFYHDFGDRLVMRPLPSEDEQIYADMVLMWRNEGERKLKDFIRFLQEKDN